MKAFRISNIAAAFLILGVIALSAARASADSVIVGPTNSGGDCTFPCMTELQQSYSASLFSGPIDINQITFFAGINTQINATYSLYVGYTNGPYTSLTTDFPSNVGPNGETLFQSQTFSGYDNNTFSYLPVSFDGSFDYDPSQGDLLVDIFQTNETGVNEGDFAAGAPLAASRAYNWSPQYCNGCTDAGVGYIISTEFDGGPVTGTPVPGAVALLGAGLAGLGALRRRKAK